MAKKGVRHDWSRGKPKFTRAQIAKALELKARGLPYREIEARTGINYSYICQLAKRIADVAPVRQLESERARKAAVSLLLAELERLNRRRDKVRAALLKYGHSAGLIVMLSPAEQEAMRMSFAKEYMERYESTRKALLTLQQDRKELPQEEP